MLVELKHTIHPLGSLQDGFTKHKLILVFHVCILVHLNGIAQGCTESVKQLDFDILCYLIYSPLNCDIQDGNKSSFPSCCFAKNFPQNLLWRWKNQLLPDVKRLFALPRNMKHVNQQTLTLMIVLFRSFSLKIIHSPVPHRRILSLPHCADVQWGK